jgi:methylated-DNA-protein-cysteine methyltransferase-like protein
VDEKTKNLFIHSILKMSQFKQQVIEIVKIVPYGKVVSYGQVAIMAGLPRMARHVGNVLNKYDGSEDIPWWRVVNNSGRLSIKGSTFTAEDQKVFLESEGIEINSDYSFDISEYRFIPDIKLLQKLKLDDEYIELLMRKFAA